MCRDYLRGSSENQKKVALAVWENVCKPNIYGGLNIISCKLWNAAFVGKPIWLLNERKEILWIRWIHDVYMKQNLDLWTHIPPVDSSLYWRRLNKLKLSMTN
ncbi:hypothetical protein RND71_028325 [Anisodus tanguticus]|uniref:Uncharacterized protein n=1 Tax=Anisodus tanguticus TaxID=243964 RepID=A0AAE1V2J3_9SOLA|nr:hypothetical protein RND71_028325 [Anisodus tanguticus]